MEAVDTSHSGPSTLIAMMWLPVGLLYTFLVGACSVQPWQAWLILGGWFLVQIVANFSVGPWLDNRFGDVPGFFITVGRSMGAALAIAVVSSPVLILLPDSTTSCW